MLQAAESLFATLGDPTRRALFERLVRDGELSVRALKEGTSVSQPAVSQHLGVLKTAGLVRARQDGRQTHYSADPKGLRPLIDWVGVYGAFWHDRVDALENLLNRMDQ